MTRQTSVPETHPNGDSNRDSLTDKCSSLPEEYDVMEVKSVTDENDVMEFKTLTEDKISLEDKMSL